MWLAADAAADRERAVGDVAVVGILLFHRVECVGSLRFAVPCFPWVGSAILICTSW